jgi:hypothetical protein
MDVGCCSGVGMLTVVRKLAPEQDPTYASGLSTLFQIYPKSLGSYILPNKFSCLITPSVNAEVTLAKNIRICVDHCLKAFEIIPSVRK